MNLFSYIKQRLPILDIVNEYATLKKAGHYWKACCPFHYERTASFTVSPHKEIFYCFGCQAGGDVISFITKIEHCSPLEAARHLVDRYQIPIPDEITWEKSSNSEEAKKSYYATLAVFAAWCHKQLEKHEPALNYLKARSITAESIEAFTLGYCPTNVKSLLTFAQTEGIIAQNFIDAHMLLEGRTGLYCPFEERIIFPIRDHLGRFVGFGGRTFKEGDERAKYYNSHDHTFFNKGTILYGLDRAKKAIAKKEAALLVEGYTDLVMLHQYGFTNSVATLGTACTQDHLKQLSRYAQRVYVMYDGDGAGQNAVMRMAELCWQVAIDLYVLTLPASDDPAIFLLSGGNLKEKIEKAHTIFSFVVNHLGEDFSKKSLQERLAITKKVITLISQIEDPIKRNLLLKQASDTFALPLETLVTIKNTRNNAQERVVHSRHQAAPLASGAYAQKDTESNSPVPDHPLSKISQLEKKLFFGILYTRITLSNEDENLIHLLIDEPLKKLFKLLGEHKSKNDIDVRTLFDVLNEDEKAFIASLAMPSEEPDNQDNSTSAELKADASQAAPSSVQDDTLLDQFYKKQWKKKVHDVKLRVHEAQQRNDEEQVKTLLTDLDALKRKMLGRDIT